MDNERIITPVKATSESARGLGYFIQSGPPDQENLIEISDYHPQGVVDHAGFPFEHDNQPQLVRMAHFLEQSDGEVKYLERHQTLSQLFVVLGPGAVAITLSPPTSKESDVVPSFEKLKCLYFSEPGTGILLHPGTWHEFPMAATSQPTTVLTVIAEEVVETLHNETGELDTPLIEKQRLDQYGFLARVAL